MTVKTKFYLLREKRGLYVAVSDFVLLVHWWKAVEMSLQRFSYQTYLKLERD